MSWPERKTASLWSARDTTRRWRITTSSCGNSRTAYGLGLRASTIATSTSRAIQRTVWLQRLIFRSRGQEKEAVARDAAASFDGGWTGLLGERGDCGSLVVLHVEDGVQLGDLEEVMDLFGQVEQLQLAAAVLHRGEGADQLADA